MSADNESNTGLVLALVGAGAALVWWLWRGRGSRNAGREGGDPSERTAKVVLRIGSGDRVSVDGVEMDLAAAVERARHASVVEVCPRGDARHGWVEAVQSALQAAGVRFEFYRLPHQIPGS
jgi:hypothetical protein